MKLTDLTSQSNYYLTEDQEFNSSTERTALEIVGCTLNDMDRLWKSKIFWMMVTILQ